VTAQRKKKKVLASAGATLCAVSLLGGSVWYLNRPTHDIPVIPTSDENEVTTTADVTPTESTTVPGETPTTTTTAAIVAPPTTVVPTTVAPTTGKTEPPKSSNTKQSATGYIPPLPTTTQPTTTLPKKKVITGVDTGWDFVDEGSLPVFSHLLREMMDLYKDKDVLYGVVIAIVPPSLKEEQLIELGYRNPTEEQRIENEVWFAQDDFCYDDAIFGLYEDHAEKLAIYYDARDRWLKYHFEKYGNVEDIENEAIRLRKMGTMASYEALELEVQVTILQRAGESGWGELYRQAKEKREEARSYFMQVHEMERKVEAEYREKKLEELRAALLAQGDATPIAAPSYAPQYEYYYAELSAEQLNALAAHGGYAFRLASEPKTGFIIDM
jgi:hypothetical protein